jgi:glycerophosphoryl diester phosphodiesterase
VARPLIFAHRACPFDEPENSLAGIRKAAELGADGVEIDVRLSLDGLPFLMHDDLMRRTTGFPLPVELTPSFLIRRQRLLNGEPVPTLAEAMDALPGGLTLALDIKTPWAVPVALREVRRRRLEQRTLLWCTSARACAWAAGHAPQVEVAYLKTALDPQSQRSFLDKAVAIAAGAVSTHWLAVSAEHIADAHQRGLRVFSFHESYPLDPVRLRAGLDILITDFVKEARAAL